MRATPEAVPAARPPPQLAACTLAGCGCAWRSRCEKLGAQLLEREAEVSPNLAGNHYVYQHTPCLRSLTQCKPAHRAGPFWQAGRATGLSLQVLRFRGHCNHLTNPAWAAQQEYTQRPACARICRKPRVLSRKHPLPTSVGLHAIDGQPASDMNEVQSEHRQRKLRRGHQVILCSETT